MAQTKEPKIDINVHRRILRFLNAARIPEDLMMPPRNEILLVDQRVMEADVELHHDEVPDFHGHPERDPERLKEAAPLFDRELAKQVLCARDDYSPLHGFRHISQIEEIPGFSREILDRLIRLFGPRSRGKWELLYQAH